MEIQATYRYTLVVIWANTLPFTSRIRALAPCAQDGHTASVPSGLFTSGLFIYLARSPQLNLGHTGIFGTVTNLVLALATRFPQS